MSQSDPDSSGKQNTVQKRRKKPSPKKAQENPNHDIGKESEKKFSRKKDRSLLIENSNQKMELASSKEDTSEEQSPTEADPNRSGLQEESWWEKIKNMVSLSSSQNGHSELNSKDEKENGREDSESRKEKIFALLKGKSISEVMIPRIDIVSAQLGKSLNHYIKIAIDSGYSRIPVYENDVDEIIGILHVKDLLKYSRRSTKEFNVKSILRDPMILPESMELPSLLKNFLATKNHMAIAVDEYGGVSGIVTLEDVLEELVGEIHDEFDEEEELIQKVGDSRFLVNGRLSLEEAGELFHRDFPRDEFDTLGGFIYHLLGRVPEKQEIVVFENLSFKVTVLEGKRIKRIQVDVQQEDEV